MTIDIICWSFLVLNLLAGIVCIASEVNKKQDAAGKSLMTIIGIILILFAAAGLLFLLLHLPYLSLLIIAIPTVIILRQVFIFIKEY